MRRIASFGTAVVLLISLSCAAPSVRGITPSPFSKNISFSILEDYDKGEDLEQVAADFALFRELGITTWRGSFGWDDYEPSREVYDFAWLHRFAELARRNGIALRPYIGYTPEWAAAQGGTDEDVWNNPPARIDDWYHFVFNLASAMRQHTNVLSFEIYNEENARMWWDGSPGKYNEVLKSGSDAVRAARGNDQVLFGGMTYPDLPWIEAACVTFGNGRTFDVLPIHAYPETWTERNVTVENYLDQGTPGYFHEDFLPEVDQGCGAKPIWLNEIGFATTPGKKTERDQANWWARAFATFLADPRVEHLGIYEIKEPEQTTGVIGETENYYLGITYHDRRRKLAFHTVKRLVSLLDTGSITVADRELEVEVIKGTKGELYHHLFIRPDGRQVLFVWDKSGAPTVQVTLAQRGTQATEYALDGTGAPYRAFDGKMLQNIQLTPGDVRIFEIAP
jgi:hypothetical protein